jgi:peptide/nickel transport system permease protein
MAQDAQKTAIPAGAAAGTPVEPGSSPLAQEGDSRLRLDQARVRPQRSLWNNAWRQFRRHKLAMAGLVIFVSFLLITMIGPFVYGRPVNSPFEYDTSQTPSLSNLMGTDSMGQDILARILYGGRISLAVGLVAAFVAILIGTLVGAIAGFFGGFLDGFLMRVTDLFLALPNLPLLLLITFLFGQSMRNFGDDVFGSTTVGIFLLIVIVIGGLAWMQTARLVRASFLSVKEKEFVEAARSIGANQSSLIFKQILPNVLSPIIVAATLEVGAAIITESSLSFLGLGFPSDVPTWGRMLFEAKDYIQMSPHEALIPGAMIFLTVLAINYMGDGLRDALDPRKSH